MKALITAVILTSTAVATSAQAEVYKWQDELCDVQGEFDNKKYSAKQIENSHTLFERLTRTNLNSFSSPIYIDHLDKLSMRDLDTLAEEYKHVKSDVEQLEVVPQAQIYKRELLKSIDGGYVRNKLTILAYLDPVQAMRMSPPMCKQYLAPFFKNDAAVQSKWQQLVKKRALTNTSAMSRYQEQKASNPAEYAKIDLLTYGFGNCVNSQVYHADSQIVFDNYNQLNKTLFGKSLTMVCDEP